MRRALYSLYCIFFLAGCDQIAGPLLPGGNGAGRLPAEQRQPDVRNALLEKLQGQTLEQKLQTLLNIVKHDSSEAARRDALQYLNGLGHDASSLGEALAEQLLVESSVYMITPIKETLVAIQADVEPFLVSAAESASDSEKLLIMETLGTLSGSRPETLSFLQTQLDSQNSAAVIAACEAIRKIGPEAKGALSKLIDLAGKPRASLNGNTDGGRAFRNGRDLQSAAIRAIAAVGADSSAIEVLTAALSQEPQIAEHAATALGNIGPAAAAALPELQKLDARDDHGGKDIKTRLAKEAAAKAIQAIQGSSR